MQFKTQLGKKKKNPLRWSPTNGTIYLLIDKKVKLILLKQFLIKINLEITESL